ncbi:MAG: UDP-2,3-diacylglucosamine diphosphatase LpxI [Holosporaceae bacterium]|nr:UDP-2,3-diacylglucosamine diphosphatase LpxI [Holosporaceae bacterium]
MKCRSKSQGSNTKKCAESAEQECIGIVCGGGNYPLLIARFCSRKNIRFCLVLLKGFAVLSDYADCSAIAETVVDFGEIEKALSFFRKHRVKKIALAGTVKRPDFFKMSMDATAAFWLLKLGKKIFSGDDALLRGIAALLQQEGFELINGTDLMLDAFVPVGVCTEKHPTVAEYCDMKKGFDVAKALGGLDVGQSVIVWNGLVLGVECFEGTDELIERCARLRKVENGGILIKAVKPQQDRKLDLPTIGKNTVNLLHKNGFSGVALEADGCIVLEKKHVIGQLDQFGMFLCGCDKKFLDQMS